MNSRIVVLKWVNLEGWKDREMHRNEHAYITGLEGLLRVDSFMTLDTSCAVCRMCECM